MTPQHWKGLGFSGVKKNNFMALGKNCYLYANRLGVIRGNLTIVEKQLGSASVFLGSLANCSTMSLVQTFNFHCINIRALHLYLKQDDSMV